MKSPYVLRKLAEYNAIPKPKPVTIEPTPPPGHYEANAYTRELRKRVLAVSWFDVRDAYLAGYKQGMKHE